MISNTKETRKQLKRKFISLKDKIQILNRLEGGEKISSVAKSTNLNESTIRTLKKNADNIRKTVANSCPLGAKRVTRTRNTNMVKMERALMIWLEDCIAKKIPMSGNLIKQKALKIYEHLRNIGHSSAGLENHSFIASKGWFEKLKKRYSLRLSDEGFAVNRQDVEELVLREETLDEEELMELIDASTPNALVNENKENEWVPNLDLHDVRKGLNLAKELELHFIQTDRSTVRSAKFKREFRNCLAPYREVLVELEKKAQIENQREDKPSEEDIRPIKRRRVRRLIFDSEDEC